MSRYAKKCKTWIQGLGRTLLLSALSIVALTLAPVSPNSYSIPSSLILDVTTLEATKRFGNQSTVHFLDTFYDLRGAPTVHLFLVTKHQGSIPEDWEISVEEGRKLRNEGESLISAGRTEEGDMLISRSKELLFQEEYYGTLLISAKDEQPSTVAFHDGLPTYLIAKKEVEERAENFSDGESATLIGVLYLSPLEYYFEFEIDGQKILVSPFDPQIVLRANFEGHFESSPRSVYKEHSLDTPDPSQRDSYELKEEAYTDAHRTGQSFDSRIISGVPDYNQRPSLLNSCAPTAGACLFGYWDAVGYEDFLKGVGTYADVTLLIKELCDTMNWDPSSGVYYWWVPVGLRHIIDDRGYEFGVNSRYGISSFSFVQEEINKGRPFIYGSQVNPWGTAHYVVVVGYEEEFIVVHDNWWSTPEDYFVNWDALGHSDDMMTILIPEGDDGFASEPLPLGLGGGGGGGCFISSVV